MNEFFSIYHFSWTNWWLTAIGLLVLYFILRFLRRLLKSFSLKGSVFKSLTNGLSTLLMVYEPLAILILGIVFLFIQPISHGVILVFVVLATFRSIRDYINGWLIRIDDVINEGVQLKFKGYQGVVSKLGNLGLFLQTTDGLHRISYTRLLSDGFTLVSGEEIRGLRQLMIEPVETNKSKHSLQQLNDLLATTPYLDWSQPPTLRLVDEKRTTIEAHFLLREDKHLQDLKQLLQQWGYKMLSS